MKDGFKIIKFVLAHNEELNNKYLNIKQHITEEFLKGIENKDSLWLADKTSSVQIKENDRNYIFYGRDRDYDREFEFVVTKSLNKIDLGIDKNDGVVLGAFYVEEEDQVSKYATTLLITNDRPALIFNKTVYSRENANVEYEPATAQISKVSYEEIEKLFTDGIKSEQN